MYVEPGWKIEVNLVEKPYEFLMPVAAIATVALPSNRIFRTFGAVAGGRGT
jgi:hypothetical protein